MALGKRVWLNVNVLYSKSPKPQKPKGKMNRVWDMGGKRIAELDYSGTNGDNSSDAQNQDPDATAEPVSSPSLLLTNSLKFTAPSFY